MKFHGYFSSVMQPPGVIRSSPHVLPTHCGFARCLKLTVSNNSNVQINYLGLVVTKASQYTRCCD
ncbi:hypothetical protein E2C01_008055 [Portunus trituberculatus]|uniref:Uncharacterized protein n=1 Tax=Portunus trituberculatus TaxID=210409 RepID=A0A5B7D0R9_PORTR|nr:hypothetical protein [Portunus trituberculatus]